MGNFIFIMVLGNVQSQKASCSERSFSPVFYIKFTRPVMVILSVLQIIQFIL